VKAKQFKRRVSGALHFDYLHATHDMQINSMILKFDPLDTDVGRFEDITVALVAATKAHCRDQVINPKKIMLPNMPCDNYQIRQAEFMTGEGCKLDGKRLLFASENSKPIDITIDHTKRTFAIQGGPLKSLIKVNGKYTPLDISIALSGHFVNFAPKAIGRESTKYVECGMSRGKHSSNLKPVYLTAAGSFDIYDPLPSNPAVYTWYEDYGLVTEKPWGIGKQYTIGQYQLGFGVHSITLLVQDKNGTVDTDTIQVTVGDTLPPDLTVPSDIIWFLVKPDIGPQKVDIGQAWAYDTCSDKVLISNNAPLNLIFQPGTTLVTWEADDGRGNTTKKIQKVILIPLDESPVLKIKDGLVYLAEANTNAMNALEDCKTMENCRIHQKPIVDAVEHLSTVLGRMSLPEGEQGFQRETLGKLESAVAALKEADSLIRRSNEERKSKRTLQAAAMERLTKARDIMLEISGRSQ
jgi:hypothetical protein